jgi:hypothetical protein
MATAMALDSRSIDSEEQSSQVQKSARCCRPLLQSIFRGELISIAALSITGEQVHEKDFS